MLLRGFYGEFGEMKWSGKFGQSVKVYSNAKNGYLNDDETQIF